jgi:hypothetical protein
LFYHSAASSNALPLKQHEGAIHDDRRAMNITCLIGVSIMPGAMLLTLIFFFASFSARVVMEIDHAISAPCLAKANAIAYPMAES